MTNTSDTCLYDKNNFVDINGKISMVPKNSDKTSKTIL